MGAVPTYTYNKASNYYNEDSEGHAYLYALYLYFVV